MARRPPGMGDVGRGRVRQNWKDIESGSTAPTWLTGGGLSESGQNLKDQIDVENNQLLEDMDTADTYSLPDLWPDKSNYYQGPSRSTRVSKHRFAPYDTDSLIPSTEGTMFVEFTNMRQRADGSTYIRRTNIYAYFNVPYSVYKSFTTTGSKGQFINKIDKTYSYAKLDDPSVFSNTYQG